MRWSRVERYVLGGGECWGVRVRCTVHGVANTTYPAPLLPYPLPLKPYLLPPLPPPLNPPYLE